MKHGNKITRRHRMTNPRKTTVSMQMQLIIHVGTRAYSNPRIHFIYTMYLFILLLLRDVKYYKVNTK